MLQQSDSDENELLCNFCFEPKPFDSIKSLRNHHRKCNFGPTKLRECLDIGFLYKSDAEFICVNCGKSLKSKNAVLLHIRRFHKENSENVIKSKAVKNKKGQIGFDCNFCERTQTFDKTRDALYHYTICHFGPHIIRHNLNVGFIYRGKNMFVCVHCGMNVKTKQGMECHLKIHSESQSASEIVSNCDESVELKLALFLQRKIPENVLILALAKTLEKKEN